MIGYLKKYKNSTLFGIKIKKLKIRKSEVTFINESGKFVTYVLRDGLSSAYSPDYILCEYQDEPEINVLK